MQENLPTFLILFFISNTYCIGTLIWYVTLRGSPIIDRRPFIINIAAACLGMCYMNVLLPRLEFMKVLSDSIPCGYAFMVQPPVLGAWLTMLVMRAVYIFILYNKNVRVAPQRSIHSLQGDVSADYANATQETLYPMSAVDQFVLSMLKRHIIRENRAEDEKKTHQTTMRQIWKWFVGLNLIYVLIVAVCNLVTISYRWKAHIPVGVSTGGCLPVANTYIIYTVLFMITLVWFPISLYSIRNIRDTCYVGAELTVVLGLVVIAICTFAVGVLARRGDFAYQLQWVLMLVVHTLSLTIPCIYATFMSRRSTKILIDYDQQSFEKVLDSPALYPALRKTVAKDLCIENILFYERIVELKSYRETEVDVLISFRTLNDVCKEFIMAGGAQELNIPDKIRKDLIQKSKLGSLVLEDFEPVLKEVLNMVYLNNFPRFVRAYKAKIDMHASSVSMPQQDWEPGSAKPEVFKVYVG